MKILIITPLDYRTFDNAEHHMAAFYRDRGDQVTVLSKLMNRTPSLWSMLWETVTCTTARHRIDGVDVVFVDPLFNYYAGLGRSIAARAAPIRSTSRLRAGALRLLARTGSLLGMLRDVFFLPCFLVAAVLRCQCHYDAAIGMGPWGALIAWVLRRAGRVGLYVYKDRDYEPGLMPDGLRQWYTAKFEVALVRRADVLISIGWRLAALRRQQSGREAAIAPMGVDWSRFAAARGRERTGCTLVYVGKLQPWSGLDVAIRGLPAIAVRVPAVRLRIIGDDLPAVRDRLRGIAASLGVADRVEFCGGIAHEKLPAALSEDADIGLANSEPIPYRQFAYPLKVVEYMAAGIPVIATRDTEAAEILDRSGSGISVVYESAAFAKSAIDLLLDRERRRRLAANAVRSSAEMTWERILDHERAVISNALGQRTVGRGQHTAAETPSHPSPRRVIAIDARPLRAQRTGVERMVANFLAYLPASVANNRILLLTDGPLPDELQKSGMDIVELPVRFRRLQSLFDAWITLQVPRELRRHDVDVFYSPNTKFPPGRVASVVTVHGLEWRFQARDYPWRERFKQRAWFALATRYSAGIVTFAENSRSDIYRLRPRLTMPLCVVPEAAEACFRRLPEVEIDRAIPARYGVPGEFILSVCSLEPRKNITTLLRSYARMVREIDTPASLVLVGRPAWRSSHLTDLASELGLGGRVFFPGYIPDAELIQLYNQARLFVYPSRYEGFGLPLLEAMACGTPVVSSNASALLEVAGDAALMVDPLSEEQTAEAMRRLLDDEALRELLVGRGIRRAASFSWAATTERIVAFLLAAKQPA